MPSRNYSTVLFYPVAYRRKEVEFDDNRQRQLQEVVKLAEKVQFFQENQFS